MRKTPSLNYGNGQNVAKNLDELGAPVTDGQVGQIQQLTPNQSQAPTRYGWTIVSTDMFGESGTEYRQLSRTVNDKQTELNVYEKRVGDAWIEITNEEFYKDNPWMTPNQNNDSITP